MENIEIRPLHENDIEALSHDFQTEGVNRDEEYFQFCLGEMKADKRITFVALVDGHFAGTAHFLFVSKYPQFQAANIPEINDLVVTPSWRSMELRENSWKPWSLSHFRRVIIASVWELVCTKIMAAHSVFMSKEVTFRMGMAFFTIIKRLNLEEWFVWMMS